MRRKDWALGFFGFFGILGIPELLTQDWINAIWIIFFTASEFGSIGFEPGIPQQIGQMFVFGFAPNLILCSALHLQKSFSFVSM